MEKQKREVKNFAITILVVALILNISLYVLSLKFDFQPYSNIWFSLISGVLLIISLFALIKLKLWGFYLFILGFILEFIRAVFRSLTEALVVLIIGSLFVYYFYKRMNVLEPLFKKRNKESSKRGKK